MIRRHLILLSSVAVVLALATGAFAYWTTSGSGTGTATNALSNGTLVLHPATVAGLGPGKSQPVTFTADNGGSSSLFVGTVVTAASVNPATCLAADFSVSPALAYTRVPASAGSDGGRDVAEKPSSLKGERVNPAGRPVGGRRRWLARLRPHRAAVPSTPCPRSAG